ncbi:MAG: hypothetical protein KJ063_02275 [Anaerolineae bacterium]|nr:hypothetical protein [Anaerolineae bacterium]
MLIIRAEFVAIVATMGGLFVFGTAFAMFINWLHARGYSEGYTSFLVVAGVLITLMANTLIHHQDPLMDLLITLACFAASGLPMIINDVFHYAHARLSDQKYIQEQANG